MPGFRFQYERRSARALGAIPQPFQMAEQGISLLRRRSEVDAREGAAGGMVDDLGQHLVGDATAPVGFPDADGFEEQVGIGYPVVDYPYYLD